MSTTSGSLTGAGSVAMSCAGDNLATIQISGTYATLVALIEASIDGGNTYDNVAVFEPSTLAFRTASLQPTDNETIAWQADVSGKSHVRIRCVSLGSGTVTVAISGQGVSPSPFAASPFTRPNAVAAPGVAHRAAVTAVDKLDASTAISVVADVTTGGNLIENTTYKVAYSAYNRWGPTTVATPASQATAADGNNTHAVRATIPQVTGADGYDLFLSTDAAPKWVARVTEAQRLAGVTITAVGTVNSTSPAANKVDIRVAGTGVATTADPFAVNNAYKPATPTAIDCTGYTVARLKIKLAVTDLRSAPTLKLATFLKNQASTDDWHLAQIDTVTLLTAVGKPQEQEISVTLNGAVGLVVLVDTISGQGSAVSVWVELV